MASPSSSRTRRSSRTADPPRRAAGALRKEADARAPRSPAPAEGRSKRRPAPVVRVTTRDAGALLSPAPATRRPKRPAPVVHVTTREGAGAILSPAVVRRRAAKMLLRLGLHGAELSVALVGDATIHALNREHRGKDRPTDVLSFPMHEPSGPPPRAPRKGPAGEVPFDPARYPGLLGDVVLSIPTAARQAKAARRRLLDEVTMLLAHGVLHLVGFDHRDDAEEREMDARTRELERAAAAPARA